jgi:enoyl-[acyl-carrier-protein] reductase (NADH)
MSEEDEYELFKPQNEKHRKIKKTVEDYVQRQGTLDENEIASDIQPILQDLGVELQTTYITNIIRKDIRNILEEEGKIEVVEEDHKGENKIKYKAKGETE